jgi:hypothetical protein
MLGITSVSDMLAVLVLTVILGAAALLERVAGRPF